MNGERDEGGNEWRNKRVAAGKWEEFTMEVNPDDIVRSGVSYVEALAGLGVNRISMGVQSLDDGALKWMNRRHNAAQARRACRIIREAGISNLSVDLIFGFGSGESLLRTIDGVLDLGGDGRPPEHISAYQLSVEPESELAGTVERGRYTPLSDEECALQYETVCNRLRAAGYRHYEISNFALPGREARHNAAYWRHVPYIGFGPAAHSLFIVPEGGSDRTPCAGTFPQHDGAGTITRQVGAAQDVDSDCGRRYIRRWNRADIGAYLNAARTDLWDGISEGETLTAEQVREERIMLALRTDTGIGLDELLGPDNPDLSRMHSPMAAKVASMIDNGSLEIQGSRVRIPERRFFVSDDIISELI